MRFCTCVNQLRHLCKSSELSQFCLFAFFVVRRFENAYFWYFGNGPRETTEHQWILDRAKTRETWCSKFQRHVETSWSFASRYCLQLSRVVRSSTSSTAIYKIRDHFRYISIYSPHKAHTKFSIEQLSWKFSNKYEIQKFQKYRSIHSPMNNPINIIQK